MQRPDGCVAVPQLGFFPFLEILFTLYKCSVFKT